MRSRVSYEFHGLPDDEHQVLICDCNRRCEEEVAESDMKE